MPRSASARKYGYKADGIVRILTAADPDEVLTALLTLGIEPRGEDSSWESVVDNLIGIALYTFVDIIRLVDTVASLVSEIGRVRDLARTGVGGPVPSAVQERIKRAAAILEARVGRTKRDSDQLRKLFQARMEAARQKYPEVREKIPDQAFQE